MNSQGRLLDTNYLIFLGGNRDRELKHSQTFLSRLSIIEYLSANFLTEEEAEYVQSMLEHICNIIEIDEEVGSLAAKIRRHDKSVRIGDAIIMATGLVYDLELMTFDKRLLKALAHHKRHFSKKK